MDNDRTKGMFYILSFFRSPMKAMSEPEKDRINTILTEYPDISVRELVDYWIDTVYRNA